MPPVAGVVDDHHQRHRQSAKRVERGEPGRCLHGALRPGDSARFRLCGQDRAIRPAIRAIASRLAPRYNKGVPTALVDRLAARTREGSLVAHEADGSVRCVACGHRCHIRDGAAGVCALRFVRGGRLLVPWGYVAGAHADPIEKKPFFHVRPGSVAFSFGMLGCDFHCAYCQNWLSSQVVRDASASSTITDLDPDDLVRVALRSGAASLISTYNEPLITAEWAAAIFRPARDAGLLTGIVSNGHGTPEAVAFLAPLVDMVKIDLKAFDDRTYRSLGGRLQPVLETIREIHARRIWLEVVTLLVPGLNDSDTELENLTGFLRNVSADIPWHVTAFHADYRMVDRPGTSPADLVRAADIGRRAGLRFVYAGNAPGRVGGLEDTRCPDCGVLLVDRHGYRVATCRVTAGNRCPQCGGGVPGVWRH